MQKPLMRTCDAKASVVSLFKNIRADYSALFAEDTRSYNRFVMVILHALSNTAYVQRNITAFRSARFQFRIGYAGRQFKIFRLIYDKDGDIYISPYFNDTNGIVSVCRYTKGDDSISLQKNGKVTSSLVKFSYHISGEVLFSTRTERVRTLVRRQAVPLHLVDHHLATIKLQGLEGGFEETSAPTTESPISSKDQILTLKVAPEDCKPYKAFKIGFYYRILESLGDDMGRSPSKSGIEFVDNKVSVGPTTMLMNRKTRTGKTLVLTAPPPKGYALSNKVMMITCEKIPVLSKEEKSTFTMIGGFNSLQDITSGRKPNEFLALAYPLSEKHKRKKDLQEKIGSIDMSY